MTNSKSYSYIAFRFTVVAIFLLIVPLAILFLNPPDILNTFVSLILLVKSGLFALAGFIFNIKGIKEPNTIKKLCSLIANSLLGLTFVFLIVFCYFQAIS